MTAEQIGEILRRYVVHSHYMASVGSRHYAVFKRRPGQSTVQCSDPLPSHADAQAERERLTAVDILELIVTEAISRSEDPGAAKLAQALSEKVS